ncbi:MAG TPA: manganese catalase family protein [Candidatus Pelethenecus faecipullorum]|uniref:Manganese catalase family protein n=1 Tax=Candidatus Pelethenecus faecipullorum TaxID=2840900 RepID=A0A9D1GQD6_9MOLU|nr:manganese catalase family protein [Candidatus Pelethenecus faecipullorum]
MWEYKKVLEFPVSISKRNLSFAKEVVTAIGGPGGELAAAIRYFMQAPTMPDKIGQNLLVEIATEEMGHVEILVALIKGLTQGATIDEIKAAGFDPIYADHGLGIYPTNATGDPFTVAYIASSGDPITDLNENLAAEAKARAGYEHLMDLTDDPEILGPLSFLRQREIIHYQRFAEALKHYQEIFKVYQ